MSENAVLKVLWYLLKEHVLIVALIVDNAKVREIDVYHAMKINFSTITNAFRIVLRDLNLIKTINA